ncbi:histidine phosphatase family protein [Phenylobacterium sp.]|uniref:SixA phosphatase family protein n=1 Tax=Phenylobacterium sp. TaxID=1871053 RepID=UPI0027355B75|nr:histidine phosphatase family protein [Phenylobacterium sp.]MDP3855979.1 histidine phosphatase family protein [Phenylobacterium sp.]
MDRLILFRHGKAERDSDSGDDFDRRLADRGVIESAAMAERLADLGLIPDLVLVSPSSRTRETWAAAASAFPKAASRVERALYHAEESTVREMAEAAGETSNTVMVVGHNPGLQDLTIRLLAEGNAPQTLIARAHGAFPPSAASVFLFDAAGRPSYDGLFFPKD